MRVVLVNGCFDPPHYGHLLHFKQALGFGDYLVVSVTSDESVRKEKGRDRPFLDQEKRLEFVRSFRCVDSAVVVPGVMCALKMICPDVFCKGPDYRGGVSEDVAQHCMARGIEIRFTDGPKWSATDVGRELRRRS